MAEDRVNRRRVLAAVALSGSVAGCTGVFGGDAGPNPADDSPRPTTDVAVTEALTGLSSPWGLAFLPDESGLLVTEQAGRLLLADLETGDRTPLSGVPEVHARGQGGLLDVTLHPEFESNGHYGSRAVFDNERYLYVSVGDRQFEDFGPEHVGQTLNDDLGSVLRFTVR